MKSASIILIIISAAMLSACSDKDRTGKELSTPVSGSVRISADETFSSIIGAEEEVFESLYPKANVIISYAAEQDVIQNLLNDSSSMVVICRDLKEDEIAYFKKIGFTTRTSKFASDAIALILNKSNTDSNITISQIKDIIAGKIITWEQLGAESISGNIQLVFDNNKSSTVRFLGELAGVKKIEASGISSLNTNEEVISFVTKNKNSIGVIGVNWISDTDDPSAAAFKESIRTMAVKGDAGTKGANDYYQPYQAYIATGEYPLSRSVYTVSREPRAGLATGFASFLAGDKGQRIVLKSGLVPATAPIRLVEIKQ